jgi:hypothetical protein
MIVHDREVPMKLPSFALLPAVTLLLGVTLLSTGCPAPTCPQCTIKKAQFTISPAEGTIVDVVMHSDGEFTGHCAGQRDPDGCTLTDEHSLGVLPQNVRQEPPLPWETDDDDQVDVRILVHRQTASGTVVQTPAPTVTIVR